MVASLLVLFVVVAGAPPKVDTLGREEGHTAFYMPPPRTLYSASAMVRERRNNMQGTETGEGGSGFAGSSRWTRFFNGTRRACLCAHCM